MKVRGIISFLILFILIFCSSLFSISAYADDGSGIDDGGAFDEIIEMESYKCYYFDLEKLDILDTFYTAINAVGNLVWNIIKLLTKLVMMIMYVSLDFDAGRLLSPLISGIQGTLHDSLFEPLFVLAFCGTAVILLRRMFVRDLMGAFGDIVKVIVIVVLSIVLVNKSDSALTLITGVTKEASVEIMTGINDNTGWGGGSDDAMTASTKFALTTAQMLWNNLVVEPWLYLEFAGTDPTEEDIDNFLNIANLPGSENRESLVDNYTGADVCFEKGRALIRLACLLVYFIPFIVKFALYIAVAGIQLIMQVITVVYMLIAPIILLLALFPGYENAISKWLRKMLEAQLGILIITFLLGIIVKVDEELYGMMDSMGGFLVVSILQMVILAGIYFGRNKIMSMLTTAQDVGRTLKQVKNDAYSASDKIRAVRERFMTDEQKYLRAYDENMKRSYDEQGYKDSYYQNIKYSEYDKLEDHQKALWLDMKQKDEQKRAEIEELENPVLSEQFGYANAFDKGLQKNYNRKKGKEMYDRKLKHMEYDDLEDYQKDYWKQLHSQESGGEGARSGQTRKAPRFEPEEKDSGNGDREDIYAGYGESAGSKGPERVIIKKKNSELKNGLPLQSDYPNVAMDNVADDGHVYQRRLYNEDRMAEKDFDTDDHNRPKAHPTGAHKHVFQGEKRIKKPLPLTEDELEENSDIIQRGVNYHDKG